jgi:demethylmacrocin O-methyltransferase
MEDTQTSYWAEYGGNETDRNDPTTVMSFIKSLVNGLHLRQFRDGHTPTYFDLHIETITFYHNLIVVKKSSTVK